MQPERRFNLQTRTSGILCSPSGERTVNKQHKGERIFARLGRVSQDEAEQWLEARKAEVRTRTDHQLRKGSRHVFREGAEKYLMECKERGVASIDAISYHVLILLPHIGEMQLEDVCNDTLAPFKRQRQAEGATNATINRSLEVVRTVLNRSARVWRGDGRPWLSTAPPLIETLDEGEQKRPPCPITWSEQARLLEHLPAHLQRMVLFAINTGARDANVCGLRWDWEHRVEELDRSVFVIPASEFKSRRPHVLILNDAAAAVIEECRGHHDEFVFVWRRERVKQLDKPPEMKYRRIHTMHNSGFQTARRAAGLDHVRVHDFRHTFGQRLRDAGVSGEDRALLLGHAMAGMPQHYATATIARLVEVANRVQFTSDRTTILRIVNGNRRSEVRSNVIEAEKSRKSRAARKTG